MTTDVAVVDSPLGHLRLQAENGALTSLVRTDAPLTEPQSDMLQRCAVQLQEYFAGERRSFHVPLAPQGTPFQRAVWHALTQIPYGETRSYGQIAAAIGKKGGMRAVGQANHVNPIMIIIPCHRVIRSDGSPGGYNGGVQLKEMLLALENSMPRKRTAEGSGICVCAQRADKGFPLQMPVPDTGEYEE